MADELRFDDQVAVVTGAGNGLGRAYALEFARRGARVVVNDLGSSRDGEGRSQSVAEAVVAEITEAGGKAVPNTDSVATVAGGQAIIDTALNAFGRVDAVVCNAGILRDRSFAKVEESELSALLDVHLRGAFYVSQPAFRWMKDNDVPGRFVLTTSASGLYGNFGQASYGAAKMGVVGLTRAMAIEGEKYGIRANALAPVATTRLTRPDGLRENEPLMDPDAVAPVVLALTHDSVDVSGEIYMAGMGWFARTAMVLGEGWASPHGDVPTAEDVLDHLTNIRDLSGASEVESAAATGDIMLSRAGVTA